jgi:hypothetical protein
MKISWCLRKFRWDHEQSNIWGRASSYSICGNARIFSHTYVRSPIKLWRSNSLINLYDSIHTGLSVQWQFLLVNTGQVSLNPLTQSPVSWPHGSWGLESITVPKWRGAFVWRQFIGRGSEIFAVVLVGTFFPLPQWYIAARPVPLSLSFYSLSRSFSPEFSRLRD